jgi:formylglycine-generating enzyme required for sulfatase activity
VTDVSWDDIARQYLPWLARKTGKTYRLLSESEWEYAARAGTTTPFSFGSTIAKSQARVSAMSIMGTAEVGSFPPNSFGLHDMHGNVKEWVQDCRNISYTGAPSDGSAWQTGGCGLRMVRGGAWDTSPAHVRSAYRYMHTPSERVHNVGFRVARTL